MMTASSAMPGWRSAAWPISPGAQLPRKRCSSDRSRTKRGCDPPRKKNWRMLAATSTTRSKSNWRSGPLYARLQPLLGVRQMDDLIGQPLDRIDARVKVTGRAVYAYEHDVPNAAYAVMVVSSIANGRIISMDTHAAEKAGGVLLVMTHQNSLKLPGAQNQSKTSPPGHAVQVLQDDLVYYANQPIGVVVAGTFADAIAGAQLVQVQYAPEAPQFDLESRLATAYAPDKAGGGGDPSASHRGDAQAGMAQADKHIDHVYWTPFEVHNPMEPHATIAVWD